MSPRLDAHRAANGADLLNAERVVMELCSLVGARAKVIELGVGDGRNSIYMARHALDVDMFDTSTTALHAVASRAEQESLRVQPIAGDLATCSPVLSSYEAVVCTHVLHFLPRARGQELLEFLATGDRAPRVQALGVITRHGDFSSRYPERYFVESGELQSLYVGSRWNTVITYEKDRVMIARHPDGRHMRNVISYLLAWRRTGT